jgi:hypothetical protein
VGVLKQLLYQRYKKANKDKDQAKVALKAKIRVRPGGVKGEAMAENRQVIGKMRI